MLVFSRDGRVCVKILDVYNEALREDFKKWPTKAVLILCRNLRIL